MKLIRKKQSDLEADLQRLESQLVEYLHPVTPRLSFTKNLKALILSGKIPVKQRLFSNKTTNRLLVAGGVIGSFVMLITSIRGLISLISVITLFIKNSNKNTQEKQASLA